MIFIEPKSDFLSENTMKPSHYPAPVSLRANSLENPVGIDDPRPVLSWINLWSARGAMQTAVRIVAAVSPEALAQGHYLWDSQKIPFDGTAIPYGGAALTGRMRVYWKAQTWNEREQVTDWSEPAFFELGLLQDSEWKGPWLGTQGTTCPLFRCSFALLQPRKQVIRARFYGSGLGYYEARLNGVKLGTQVLAPEYTDYSKRVTYQTFDITASLAVGENVLGMIVAGGWFDRFEYGAPQFRCQVEVEYTDGTRQVIGTDPEEWRTATGPWREADPFHGESYDARLERSGWDQPRYDEAGEWSAVSPQHSQAGGKMVGQKNEPIRVTQELAPVAIRKLPGGAQVVDFGQNFAGWVRLSVRGAAGTMIRMRFGERVNEDGSVFQANLRSAHATDRYTLKGKGTEVWEPRFTYHGFRYVQVEGVPRLSAGWRVTGQVVHSDIQRRGKFECSDDRLTRLSLNVDWTLRSNMLSVFTDCPQRDERQGWLGDAQLTAETVFHHFNPAAFYHKWMDDIQDIQTEAGNRWSPVAPPWYTNGYSATQGRESQADLVWTSAGTLIPWLMWLYHGDRRIIETSFPMIEKHIDWVMAQPEAPLAPYCQWGDWLFMGHGKSLPPTDLVLLSSAFFLKQLQCAAELTNQWPLGWEHKRTRFERIASELKAVLRERFYNAAEGTFGSQTADALALVFGFAPLGERSRILAHLVDDITVRCRGHLASGIVGTKYVLEALSQEGRTDIAFKVVTVEGYPGWMDMLKHGATTITERWNFEGDLGMNSHNHPVFGTVSGWMYRWLAGIRIDPGQPGYRHFVVAPETPEGLDWAGASLATVRGVASIRWTRGRKGFKLDLQVPPSSEATVLFPGSEPPDAIVLEGGKPLVASPFVTPGPRDRLTGRATARVQSGHYRFEVRLHGT